MVAMLAVGPLVSAKPMSRDYCLQSQMQTRALASNGLSRGSASKARKLGFLRRMPDQSGVTLAEFKQPNWDMRSGSKADVVATHPHVG